MLGSILALDAFGFLLVVTRMVAIVMIMPGLGDQTIPSRVRVMLGLSIGLLVFFMVRQSVPALPNSVWLLAGLLLRELLIGVAIGLIGRMLFSAVHTAGFIIAMQSGLAAAQTFDPSQGTQGALVSAFLTIVATVVIFATDLHHVMIMAMVHSYETFPMGGSFPVTDFASVARHYISESFMLGAQLAAPFLVYGLTYNMSLGLLTRLIQQFPVFFVAMPVNIFLGMSLLMILLPVIILAFLEKYQTHLMDILG